MRALWRCKFARLALFWFCARFETLHPSNPKFDMGGLVVNVFREVRTPSVMTLGATGLMAASAGWVVVVMLGIYPLRAIAGGDEQVGSNLLWGLIAVATIIGVGVGLHYSRGAYRLGMKRRAEWVDAHAGYQNSLAEARAGIRDQGIPWLIAIDWSAYGGRFLVRPGESIMWMAEADMYVDGHRGQAGHHAQGTGLVVVTTKRFVFVPDGNEATWAKTWGSLIGWEGAQNGFIIRASSGKPKTFIMRNAGVNPIEDGNIGNDVLNLLLSPRHNA